MQATVELVPAESNPLQSFEQSEVSNELASYRRSGVVRITDATSCQLASERMGLNRALLKRIEVWWDPICSKLYSAWKAATSARAMFTDPLEADYKAQSAEVLRYEAELKAKAEEQVQQAEEEQAPWDDEPQPLPPPVMMPVTPGISTRNKPWQVRVDLDKLIEAAAKDKSLRQYLVADEKLLKFKAKSLGKALEDIVPGIEVYRERTVVNR